MSSSWFRVRPFSKRQIPRGRSCGFRPPTIMRPSEAFACLEPAKSRFCLALVEALAAVSGVRSVTFTGSFVDKPGLEGISDIDVVVVVDELTAITFDACRSAAAATNPALLGLASHTIRINDTFGPL